jgi:hypothetical protein
MSLEFLRNLFANAHPVTAEPDNVLVPPPEDLRRLTEADYEAVARQLNVEVAVIKAVMEVESAGKGFLPDGRPTILYEAHVFNRLTGGAHLGKTDRFGVPLAVQSWDRSLYGRSGAHQYIRLEDAMELDEKNACFSASWGLAQIMGFNFASLGYGDVDTFRKFIEATNTARKQLDMLVQFIIVNGLATHLRTKNWREFARRYNGPAFAQNQYDTKLAAAYRRHAGHD